MCMYNMHFRVYHFIAWRRPISYHIISSLISSLSNRVLRFFQGSARYPLSPSSPLLAALSPQLSPRYDNAILPSICVKKEKKSIDGPPPLPHDSKREREKKGGVYRCMLSLYLPLSLTHSLPSSIYLSTSSSPSTSACSSSPHKGGGYRVYPHIPSSRLSRRHPPSSPSWILASNQHVSRTVYMPHSPFFFFSPPSLSLSLVCARSLVCRW